MIIRKCWWRMGRSGREYQWVEKTKYRRIEERRTHTHKMWLLLQSDDNDDDAIRTMFFDWLCSALDDLSACPRMDHACSREMRKSIFVVVRRLREPIESERTRGKRKGKRVARLIMMENWNCRCALEVLSELCSRYGWYRHLTEC